MKTMMKRLFSFAIGSSALGLVLAGTLDPSGSPAPKRVTLQQVFDKLGSAAHVIRTGQTGCWDAAGTPIACSGTGRDGALVKGASASPRFTDNGDGTVEERELLWWWQHLDVLADAGERLASGQCGLSDGSLAGTWRLPNVKALSSPLDFGPSSPALPLGHPFVSVATFYWTSTTVVNNPSHAWGGVPVGWHGVQHLRQEQHQQSLAGPQWARRGFVLV